MYLLGLLLLIVSTWYLLKLYKNFSDDPIAQKEVSKAWKEAKNEAKGKNPFAPGRIKAALNSYKLDMAKDRLNEEDLAREEEK